MNRRTTHRAVRPSTSFVVISPPRRFDRDQVSLIANIIVGGCIGLSCMALFVFAVVGVRW